MIRTLRLSVELDGRVVLDEINLSVEAGESVALVGANGSGKTTAIRALLGLVPFRGTIQVAGYDLAKDPIGARRLLGYLPQKAAFGGAPAIEVLTFVAAVRGVSRARVGEALHRVGLLEHAQRSTRVFSGGMLQRLSLAAALLGDPPVCLFDEPTASLDREGQAIFFDVCAELRRAGRTLLLASHRADEIARLTDRVIEIEAGRLSVRDRGMPHAPRGAKVIAIGAKASAR